MRRIYIILLTLVMLIFFVQPTVFGQLIQVCIDPGHGGPGASKYRNIQGRMLSTFLSTFPKDNLVKISINGKKTLDKPELLDYTFIDSKYI